MKKRSTQKNEEKRQLDAYHDIAGHCLVIQLIIMH